MIIRQLFLTTGLLFAATFGAQAGSLAQWSEQAFQHHPERNLSAAERALGDSLNMKSSKWLADTPTANLKYQTDAIGSDIGFREWEGGVDLPLWQTGLRKQLKTEATRSTSLAESMLVAKRLEVSGEVRLRWWDVALFQAEHVHAKSMLETTRKLFRDVERKVVAGELPRSDLLLAKNSVLSSEDNVQLTKNRLRQKLALFTAYTYVSENIDAAAEQATSQTELSPQHPLLVQANAQVDKARSHRNRVKGESAGSSSLWLGAKTVKSTSGVGYDDSVGIELSIPFSGSAHIAPAIAAAEQALTQTIAERDRTHHELEEQLQLAQLEQTLTSDAISRSVERQSIAQERLQLNYRAFELGETDVLRLLQAQTDANAAKQNLLLSQINADRAISLLNQAQGVLPQ